MSEITNVLEIKMLGGFSLTYNGEEIVLGRNTTAKFVQLLQIVWLNSGEGVSKGHLVQDLYDTGELSNPNNSFNNLIFQMRKQMVISGLPRMDYIVKREKLFVPDPEMPVSIDVKEFSNLCEQAMAAGDNKEKNELYLKAIDLYRGELLPELQTKTWVITEAVRLHHLFDEAVVFCGNYAKDERDFDTMYKLYGKAASIYPDNDWQAYQIEALIGKENYKDAYLLYDKTVHRYADEMGLPPSEKMLENYRVMSEKILSPSSGISDIHEALQEDADTGAYYCSYPSFIDTYHILERNMERTGFSVFLLLCTLVDYEGKAIQNKEKLKNMSDSLKKVIFASLRRGDIFAKYSAQQYVILLVGTSTEGCDVIADRISKKMKEVEGTRAGLKFSNVPIAEITRL